MTTFLRDWAPGVTDDDVLRQQGADPGELRSRSPRAADAASMAVRDGAGLVTPLVHQKRYRIDARRHERLVLSEGRGLSGSLPAHGLAASEQVLAIACSIGPRLEQRVSITIRDDPAYAIALDEYGTLALTSLTRALCTYVGESADREGLHATMPIQPGMRGWPVGEGQDQVFRLLDERDRDVVLTSDGYMIPRKSTSFVIGIGRSPQPDSGSPCDWCDLNDRCSYRNQYEQSRHA